MKEERGRGGGPPHAAVIAAVVMVVMVLPTLIGDQWDAVAGSIAELLSPLGLLLLPISLIFAIRFLSSAGAANPNSIPRAAAGSTAGVVVFLLLVLLLLYSRVSFFSNDYDSESS